MTVQPGVVIVSGHMVDTPDRPQPRFPPEQVPRVAGEVQAALERWDVGPGTTLVTGGARGADIVAAEAARARGARLRLVLACRPDDFVKGSVALPGTDWEERFYALLGQADVEVVGGPDDDVYARTNDRIIAAAREIDDRPHAIIVWNGDPGDGPGGTSDFAARLGRASGDERVVIIDPAPS
jgi:hypothetical protein